MTLFMERSDSQPRHYDPQKMGRLKDDIIVLRKVNRKRLLFKATPQSNSAWELIGGAQVQLHVREDQLPWYEQDFIVNDQPRDEKVARDIAKATIGFAVARTDSGEILQTFGPDELDVATAAAKNAKLVLTPRVQTIIPEKDDQEDLIQKFLAKAEAEGETPPEANQEA